MKFSEMVSKTDEIKDLNINLDFEVNNLRYSSKLVEPRDVFFAIKGFKFDGNTFIPEALSNGANAVITDCKEVINDNHIYRVIDCRKAMAEFSNIFYDYPSRKLKVIGVTGTNGKTTVSNIINFVLEYCGHKTGLIGTNGNFINKKFIESSHTTPESVDLNYLMNEMVKSGVEFLTMEVSSHALELKRVYGIDFDITVFTNLTPEHLDFHKNMNEYLNSKKKLFDSTEIINKKGNNTAVIYNSDDEHSEKIIKDSVSRKISFGFNPANYSIANFQMNFNGMKFEIGVPSNDEGIDRIKIETKLTGRFNIYNILASTAVLRYLNISYLNISEAIAQFKEVDGRFNQIRLKNGATAIIDYSHTPDSLSNALTTIKEILNSNGSKGKIITVFGCGGNRDKSKRPKMGKIATEYSDHTVITSDNPRDEEALDIINEIKMGIRSNNFEIDVDREKAIEKAIMKSNDGDVILIAGKGHETYQEIKGVKYHLSDREIVERFI